jgi:hypothetical protein
MSDNDRIWGLPGPFCLCEEPPNACCVLCPHAGIFQDNMRRYLYWNVPMEAHTAAKNLKHAQVLPGWS